VVVVRSRWRDGYQVKQCLRAKVKGEEERGEEDVFDGYLESKQNSQEEESSKPYIQETCTWRAIPGPSF
jgi:hypothetical protein